MAVFFKTSPNNITSLNVRSNFGIILVGMNSCFEIYEIEKFDKLKKVSFF